MRFRCRNHPFLPELLVAAFPGRVSGVHFLFPSVIVYVWRACVCMCVTHWDIFPAVFFFCAVSLSVVVSIKIFFPLSFLLYVSLPFGRSLEMEDVSRQNKFIVLYYHRATQPEGGTSFSRVGSCIRLLLHVFTILALFDYKTSKGFRNVHQFHFIKDGYRFVAFYWCRIQVEPAVFFWLIGIKKMAEFVYINDVSFNYCSMTIHILTVKWFRLRITFTHYNEMYLYFTLLISHHC